MLWQRGWGEGKEIDYKLIRSRRRSICLMVRDGKLEVRAPYFALRSTVERFITQKESWIEKKIIESRKRLAKKKKPSPYSESELNEKLEKYLQELLPSRFAEFDLGNYKIRVKNYRSKWGSCSRKTLSFNSKLALAPRDVIDYVVVHELSHIKHKHHGKRFWLEVEKLCPDYKKLRRWLAKNNDELII